MPPLLQSAQLKPDVTITSADSDNDIEDSDDDRSANFVHVHLILYFINKEVLNIEGHFFVKLRYLPFDPFP